MSDRNQVATAIREELIAAGIVRHPSTAGSSLPPLIVEPRDGAPRPGDRDAPEDHPDLVITLRHSGDLAEAKIDDSWRRRSVFDVYYRSKGTTGLQLGARVDAQIRARLVSRAGDLGFGWTMGVTSPVQVVSSTMWGGLGRVSSGPEGFDEVAKYVFEVYA